MDRNPKIIVVTDEPMFMVDMMSELEGRGFSVEPMKPGDHESWCKVQGADAAIFDISQPATTYFRLASKLRRSAIPVVALGSASSFDTIQIAGAQTCLSKPVNYDSLSETLMDLINKPMALEAHESVGAMQQTDAMTADER